MLTLKIKIASQSFIFIYDLNTNLRFVLMIEYTNSCHRSVFEFSTRSLFVSHVKLTSPRFSLIWAWLFSSDTRNNKRIKLSMESEKKRFITLVLDWLIRLCRPGGLWIINLPPRPPPLCNRLCLRALAATMAPQQLAAIIYICRLISIALHVVGL